MVFFRYGIHLERLTSDDLKKLWQWRNQAFVRKQMYHNEWISWEHHQNWFSKLSPIKDWYFIGSHEGNQIGVFHIKNINTQAKIGESGAFVSTQSLLGSPVAAYGVLALMDFGFLVLELEKLEAKFNPAFKKIVAFNRKLGYKETEEEVEGFVRAQVTKKRYLEHCEDLRNAAATIQGSYSYLQNHKQVFAHYPPSWDYANIDLELLD